MGPPRGHSPFGITGTTTKNTSFFAPGTSYPRGFFFSPGRRKALQRGSELEVRRAKRVLPGQEWGPELHIPAKGHAANPPITL